MKSRGARMTVAVRVRRAIPWLLALASSTAVHCSDASDGSDARDDATRDEASARDAAADIAQPFDAGTAVDATRPDAASTDVARDATVDGSTFRAPFDWVGIVGNGQSLSIGAYGRPVIDTTQPFHNLKLSDTGPAPQYPLDGGGVLSLVPLTEPIRGPISGYHDYQYPNNIAAESPHSAMANQITVLARAAGADDYVTLHSVTGAGGQCLVDIDKDGHDGIVGRAYPAALSEARTFTAFARSAGHTFGYGAVVLTHGECDRNNTSYEHSIYRLFTEYDTDLRAITGQSTHIVMLASQQSTGGPTPVDNRPTYGSMLSVWRAGVDHPGEIVCVGPRYQYPYYTDHLHMDGVSYRRLGEKYAEVFDQVVDHGVPWHPLQPTTVTRSGAVITVHFAVPYPPLAWETSIAPSHQTTNTEFAHGRGFEVYDAHGRLTIASVAISGSAVVITLSAVPRTPGLMVRHATLQDGASTAYHGGTTQGFRGQLRDSDPFTGRDAQTVSCRVTHGSTAVVCPASGALAERGASDIVEGTGLAADTTVVETDRVTHATLSAPYNGATGTTMLRFRYDQRNYCVHFELPVD